MLHYHTVVSVYSLTENTRFCTDNPCLGELCVGEGSAGHRQEVGLTHTIVTGLLR